MDKEKKAVCYIYEVRLPMTNPSLAYFDQKRILRQYSRVKQQNGTMDSLWIFILKNVG